MAYKIGFLSNSKEVKVNLGFVLNILSLELKISEKLYKHPGEGGISKTVLCSLKDISVYICMALTKHTKLSGVPMKRNMFYKA